MLPSLKCRSRTKRAATFLALVGLLAYVPSCVRPPRGVYLQQPGQTFADYALRATQQKEKNKGWTDEQRLAIPDPGGPNPVKLRHGPLVRIIPHDDLEGFKMRDFAITGWQYVARFEVEESTNFPDGYPKLNLAPGKLNYLYLRYEGEWHALIGVCDDPIGNPAACRGRRYRVQQIEQHDAGVPGSKEPPGSARFVWSDADETVWIRCVSGCCQLGTAF